MILILIFVILAFFAPFFAPHNPSQLFSEFLRLPPAWLESGNTVYPLGTDDVGRDILSRLIHGARISMSIGLSVVFLAMTVGTVLGLFAGYYGGWIDKIVMRITDIIMALPSILLAIVVVSVLGPGLRNAVIAVAIVAIPSFTRIVRPLSSQKKKKNMFRHLAL